MSVPTEFQQLRELLLSPEVSALHSLEADFESLHNRLHDPEELARLLQPVITGVFLRGDPALSLAVIRAITPLLDRAIRDKVGQDTPGMSDALAPASTSAIALHYASDPGSAAGDLAPLVGAAIKEQIRGEREVMIDALYPIIGSTISKYLSETLNTLIRTINTRIESRFSVRGLLRKGRSLLTGVSEAELLLRESMPVRVDAAFLIHMASGLVIAEARHADAPPLDPDLLSGMLTAIRSLFNDSMTSDQGPRELDQIEYGESKIILEAAGFCYLAAVVQGIPGDDFRTQLRETMRAVVEFPGGGLEHFSGDTRRVPEGVSQTISAFVQSSRAHPAAAPSGPPRFLLATGVLLLGLLSVPFVVHLARNQRDREVEKTLNGAFAETPAAGIRVAVDRDIVRLSGIVPNEFQRKRSEEIARSTTPGLTVENLVRADAGAPFPVLIRLRVSEITAALNTLEGVLLQARVDDGNLTLNGVVPHDSLVRSVGSAFERLPGIRAIVNEVRAGVPGIQTRIYFGDNSSELRARERSPIESVRAILEGAPWARLRITGHSGRFGGRPADHRLALRRARAVHAALVLRGIPGARLLVEDGESVASESEMTGSDSLYRSVSFDLLRHPEKEQQ